MVKRIFSRNMDIVNNEKPKMKLKSLGGKMHEKTTSYRYELQKFWTQLFVYTN